MEAQFNKPPRLSVLGTFSLPHGLTPLAPVTSGFKNEKKVQHVPKHWWSWQSKSMVTHTANSTLNLKP